MVHVLSSLLNVNTALLKVEKTSLMVQWLRLYAFTAGGAGSTPGPRSSTNK